MAGEILNPKRPRYEANERFDTGDAEAASQSPRNHQDALSRSVLATPRAAGSSVPVGLIVQGFALTLNPINPTDGKVRVNSSTGVGIDSNGRVLIKESGTAVDLSIPSGTFQLYAYFIEDSVDVAVRRFLPVTSPFNEYSRAISTSLKGDVGFYVRSGDNTSIVASDVVNGQTVNLCFLGVAVNSGGAGTITMAGYDATNAPNGQYATNRLSTITAPSVPPTLATKSGSIATLQDLITAVGYFLGNAVWFGSSALTPAAANNFGAFSTCTNSVQLNAENLAAYNTLAHTWTAQQTFNLSPISVQDYRFQTSRTKIIPAGEAYIAVNPGGSNLSAFHDATYGSIKWYTFDSAMGASAIGFPVELDAGCKITGYGFRVDKTSSGSVHLYGVLTSTDQNGTTANADSANAVGPGGNWGIDYNVNNPTYATITPSNIVTVPTLDGTKEFNLVIETSGVTSDTVLWGFISYTRP